MFGILVLAYFGLQVLFIIAIVGIALLRVMRGKDRGAINEKMPVGENVLAVKESNGHKEVFK